MGQKVVKKGSKYDPKKGSHDQIVNDLTMFAWGTPHNRGDKTTSFWGQSEDPFLTGPEPVLAQIYMSAHMSWSPFGQDLSKKGSKNGPKSGQKVVPEPLLGPFLTPFWDPSQDPYFGRPQI